MLIAKSFSFNTISQNFNTKNFGVSNIKNSLFSKKTQNLSKPHTAKVYDVCQSIYSQSYISPNVEKLADSLIAIDDARAFKNLNNNKLYKQFKKNSVMDYIDGVANYIPEKTTVKDNNYSSRYKTLSKSFKESGKLSYARGRSVTAGLHHSSSFVNVINQLLKAIGEASVESALTFAGAVAGLTIAYRLVGDLFLGLRRMNIKAREETNSTLGFPKLSKPLEHGININNALKELKNVDLQETKEILENLINKANKLNPLDLDQCQSFINDLNDAFINKISHTNTAINNLINARGREKIEWQGYKLTLAFNLSHGAFQLVLGIISDLSILFAPSAPFVKLGLAGASFLSVISQHAFNHAFSGKSLKNKFMRTIYSNLKSDNFYQPSYDVQDLRELKNQFNANKISKHQYINNINNMLDIPKITKPWNKPYQHKIRIINEWLDAKIYKNLDKFIQLRLKQINYSCSKQEELEIQKLIEKLNHLYEDKEQIKKIKSKNSLFELNKIIGSLHTNKILDIFTDNHIAYKTMVKAKKNLHNEKYRYLCANFAPGLLSSIVGGSLIAGVLGTDTVNFQSGTPPVPMQTSLSLTNNLHALSQPGNNEYSEVIKQETKTKINRDLNNQHINSHIIQVDEKSILNNLLTDDEEIKRIAASGDLKFQKGEVLTNIDITRNKRFIKNLDLHNALHQGIIFKNMLTGAVRSPYLHYVKGRKVVKKHKQDFKDISDLEAALEKKISWINDGFYKDITTRTENPYVRFKY